MILFLSVFSEGRYSRWIIDHPVFFLVNKIFSQLPYLVLNLSPFNVGPILKKTFIEVWKKKWIEKNCISTKRHRGPSMVANQGIRLDEDFWSSMIDRNYPLREVVETLILKIKLNSMFKYFNNVLPKSVISTGRFDFSNEFSPRTTMPRSKSISIEVRIFRLKKRWILGRNYMK